MSSEPQTRRKVAEVWLATALARRVLPRKGSGKGGGRGMETTQRETDVKKGLRYLPVPGGP